MCCDKLSWLDEWYYVYKSKWQVSRLKQLTKSVSADRTTIYVSVHKWSKYEKMPCLRAQAIFEPTFTDCESDDITTRLTQAHNGHVGGRSTENVLSLPWNNVILRLLTHTLQTLLLKNGEVYLFAGVSARKIEKGFGENIHLHNSLLSVWIHAGLLTTIKIQKKMNPIALYRIVQPCSTTTTTFTYIFIRFERLPNVIQQKIT